MMQCGWKKPPITLPRNVQIRTHSFDCAYNATGQANASRQARALHINKTLWKHAELNYWWMLYYESKHDETRVRAEGKTFLIAKGRGQDIPHCSRLGLWSEGKTFLKTLSEAPLTGEPVSLLVRRSGWVGRCGRRGWLGGGLAISRRGDQRPCMLVTNRCTAPWLACSIAVIRAAQQPSCWQVSRHCLDEERAPPGVRDSPDLAHGVHLLEFALVRADLKNIVSRTDPARKLAMENPWRVN